MSKKIEAYYKRLKKLCEETIRIEEYLINKNVNDFIVEQVHDFSPHITEITELLNNEFRFEKKETLEDQLANNLELKELFDSLTRKAR